MTLRVHAVFADTLYWFGIINPRDGWHDAAKKARRSVGEATILVTTHEVFLEVFAAASNSPHLRRYALATFQAAREDPSVQLLPVSGALYERGLLLYAERPDKGYSLVDCISMVVMEDQGITHALTNDVHFEQEGFVALIHRTP